MAESRPSAARGTAQAAADWYLLLHEGQASASQQAAFLAWLRASPAHVAEYLAVVRLFDDLPAAAQRQTTAVDELCRRALHDEGVVVPLRPSGVADRAPPQLPAQRARKRPAVLRGWALAACVVVALTSAAWLLRPPTLPAGVVYRATPTTGRSLVLSDGSHVQLDRGSAIVVRYTAQRRRIDVLQGAALFDVDHDAARPLQVWSGQVLLRDIGTVFGVQHDGSATVRITVLSGQVQVRAQPAAWLARWRDAGDALADLHAGQQLRLDAGGQVLALETHADLAAATAWLPDRVSLHDQPLAEVARRFNAFTTVPLAIDDPLLAQRRVSGVFHLRDSEAFLAYLSTLPGVRIERDPQKIRVHALR
ncbi:FecR family protein [Xanthomonas maliensis]|uniref:FecR family protein n=1 Tax=Xanthomonas maliensis TaxID=1321368 RepID=UPI0003A7BD13|nr:FecR domain-containing protein [Xanthomonas maliensis]KAB7762238.1 iron dicitrate transport regulator FecR [Xanthomonas maliensis]